MFSRIYNRQSLEHSLQWVLGLLIALTLVVLILLAGWLGWQATFSFVASRLGHDAEAVIAGLDPKQRRLKYPLPAIYTQPFSGHYYLIRFADGKHLRSRSLWDTDFQVTPLDTGMQSTALIDGPRNQQLFVWQSAYAKQGETFTIAVAEDITPLLTSIRQFLGFGLIIALIAALSLLLIQKLILRKVFRRLEDTREDIRNIRRGKGTQLRTTAPDEIMPLVHEFNQLLSTWRDHLERSRRASGNLAHALKSPLNLIYRIGIDEKKPTIRDQAAQMQQIIERELNRARIAGSASAGKRFQPQKDVQDLIDTINMLFSEKHLEIASRIRSPDSLPFEQGDLHELIGNLLENAAKWTTHKIILTLEARHDGMKLTIEDDGPGIDTTLGESLLLRGKRLDEQIPGHGLGLSIIRDIVEQYHGHISFSHSETLGGACITVQLPIREE